jgi:hypothetical protein
MIEPPKKWGVHQWGSDRAILNEAKIQWTHISVQYHILSVKYSYYTLGLSIGYTKDLKPKDTSKDDSELAEAISLNMSSTFPSP